MIRKAVLSALFLLPAAAIWAQTLSPQPAPRVRTSIKDTRVATYKEPMSITVAEKRIDLNLDNASLAEAVKALGAKSGESVEIEDGIATEPRITLRAHNISFGTALHLLAENANAGVAMSVKDGKTAFRLTKNPAGTFTINSFFLEPHVTYTQQALGKIITVPDGTLSFTAPPGGPDKVLALPPTLYRMRMEELRSTFTCPHCKGQVTALRTRQEPKCPKCGRMFQGDWQYCPADGTKRPAISTDWRYCPLCGHRVEIEKRSPEEPGK